MKRYCEYCGKDIQEDAIFCPYCGSNPVVAYKSAEAKQNSECVKSVA